MFSPQVSTFRGSERPKPLSTELLVKVLECIYGAGLKLKIEKLRALLNDGQEKAYRSAKAQLPAVTFAGTFRPTRRKEHLIAHSGIIHGDLDHLDDAEAVKARLAQDPHLVYAFTSPSGVGLKVGVRVAPVSDDAGYKHAWQVAADYFKSHYQLAWDPSGKDISRLCFLSHDPQMYHNLSAQIFDVPPPVVRPTPTPPRRIFDVPRDRRDRYAQWAIQTTTAMIDSSVPGTRHHLRVKAAYLLGGYVGGGILSESEAFDALRAAVERNTDDLPSALKTIAYQLMAGQAEPITLDELEARRLAWLDAHRPVAPVKVQTHANDDPWVGMNTLPMRPYTGYRGYRREVTRG